MPAQDDETMLSELAERLGLEEEEADNFIGSAMKRLGYKARRMWEDDDSQGGGNNSGGDFFSTRRQGRSRDIPRGGQRRRASGFSNYE
jgi:hypothetical protein